MLYLLLTGPAGAGGLDSITVGGDHDFPPYEFIDDNGQPAGLHIDLLEAIGAERGFEVNFRLGPWAESREAIIEGDIDVLPMYVAGFRRPEIAFSEPHVIIYHEIFIPIDGEPFRSIEQLAGKRVIVQDGAWVLESLLDMNLEADLTLVETERAALRLLARGEHDAALVSEIVGRRTLMEENLDGLTTSGPALLPVEYALAVASGNQALLAELNAGLEALKASGRFNALHRDWLGRLSDQPGHRSGQWLPIIVAVAVLVLLGAALVAWQFRQRSSKRLSGRGNIDFHYHHDALTGLPNRAGLEKHLQSRLRERSQQPGHFALLHIDLDQFKLVNDSGNYQIGDRVLNNIADLIKRQLGRRDVLARLGSDEFCVLLAEADETRARSIAETLRSSLENERFEAGDDSLQVTASFGLTVADEPQASIGELLKRSEAACHAGKESGRNRVHVYHPDDETLARRHGAMRWAHETRLALAEQRLALYYQTIEPARADAGSDICIELLLRMNLSDGRVASAGEFVPAAEKYFIAHQLDRWVVATAFSWLARHRDRLGNITRVYINISARSLGDDRFLPYVLEQFQTHQVPPELIGFELTETAMMTHLDTGLATIQRLRAMGCTLALDDFGVGISSMAYLKKLPVDILKIDGSFSRASVDSERERALLAEINELGHVLGKITVAEQVETQAIRDMMVEIGVDRVQGWAMSRPRPLEEMPLN